MKSTTRRFEKVELKRTKSWTEDGRRRQQTRTFMQTINPWNTKADGTAKSRHDIYTELCAEADEWEVVK